MNVLENVVDVETTIKERKRQEEERKRKEEEERKRKAEKDVLNALRIASAIFGFF